MKFIFFADPLDKLKTETDTSLAILRVSLSRKHKVSWATPDCLRLVNGRLRVKATPCLSCSVDKTPTTGPAEERNLSDYDVVWIRKDPPFDASYVALCWLLSLEEEKILMINKPSLLLRFHEKLIPYQGVLMGFLKSSDLIPTHIGDSASAKEYVEGNRYSPFIRKPFYGHAGGEVRKYTAFENKNEPGLQMTQPFIPEIGKQGDRRVFFLSGKRIGDFVRLPKPGDHVSNLARGGSAHLQPMTASQVAVADRLGDFLRSVGIAFAGADMIGKRVSEVNVTSPTGVRTFAKLTGLDLSEMIVRYAERKAE